MTKSIEKQIQAAADKMARRMTSEGQTPAQVAQALRINFPSLFPAIKADGHINFTKTNDGVITDVRMLMVVKHENQSTIEIRLSERFGRYEVGYSFSSGRATSLAEMRAWNATLEEYGQLFELLADQLTNSLNTSQSVARAVIDKYTDAIANHNYAVCFGG